MPHSKDKEKPEAEVEVSKEAIEANAPPHHPSAEKYYRHGQYPHSVDKEKPEAAVEVSKEPTEANAPTHHPSAEEYYRHGRHHPSQAKEKPEAEAEDSKEATKTNVPPHHTSAEEYYRRGQRFAYPGAAYYRKEMYGAAYQGSYPHAGDEQYRHGPHFDPGPHRHYGEEEPCPCNDTGGEYLYYEFIPAEGRTAVTVVTAETVRIKTITVEVPRFDTPEAPFNPETVSSVQFPFGYSGGHRSVTNLREPPVITEVTSEEECEAGDNAAVPDKNKSEKSSKHSVSDGENLKYDDGAEPHTVTLHLSEDPETFLGSGIDFETRYGTESLDQKQQGGPRKNTTESDQVSHESLEPGHSARNSRKKT